MKAGLVSMYPTDKGTMFIPTSISFAAMDEFEFSEMYGKVLDQVLKLTGADKKELEAEILSFM